MNNKLSRKNTVFFPQRLLFVIKFIKKKIKSSFFKLDLLIYQLKISSIDKAPLTKILRFWILLLYYDLSFVSTINIIFKKLKLVSSR